MTSKVIWASEYRFLNDQEEYIHAKRLTESVIDEELETTASGVPLREQLRKIANLAFNSGHLHEDRLKIMVASFSEVGDQLSQWRGYAGDSTGVSLGLDLRHLRGPSGIATTETFAPCIYKESEKRALLKAIFADCATGLERYLLATVESGRRRIAEKEITDHAALWEHIRASNGELNELLFRTQRELQYDLLRIAPLLKNESFAEEREWRLVLPIEPTFLPTNRAIDFRATSNSLIPYVAYPLLMRNQEGPISCRHVFIGPGGHRSATVGVNMFLARNGIPISVSHSQIPYRPK